METLIPLYIYNTCISKRTGEEGALLKIVLCTNTTPQKWVSFALAFGPTKWVKVFYISGIFFPNEYPALYVDIEAFGQDKIWSINLSISGECCCCWMAALVQGKWNWWDSSSTAVCTLFSKARKYGNVTYNLLLSSPLDTPLYRTTKCSSQKSCISVR